MTPSTKVREIVDKAPELTEEQIEKLRALLAREKVGSLK